MKYQDTLLQIHFHRIVKGSGTSLQSSKLNQKNAGDVCRNLHYPLAKFHFDTSKDSKEIVKKSLYYT